MKVRTMSPFSVERVSLLNMVLLHAEVRPRVRNRIVNILFISSS